MPERSQKTLVVVGLAFLLAIGTAAGTLMMRGTGVDGVDAALAATARIAFVFFWPCYVGGALTVLLGPVFLPLKRMGRDLGLAFAAVEVVHLSLVVRLCMIGAVPSRSTFILFGSAAIFTYLIALLSIAALRRQIHPALTRAVWVVGMNLIAYAFLRDFLNGHFSGTPRHVIAYVPFTILALAGPTLRLAAFTKYIDRVLKHSPYSLG
jgi:hypothetical protein